MIFRWHSGFMQTLLYRRCNGPGQRSGDGPHHGIGEGPNQFRRRGMSAERIRRDRAGRVDVASPDQMS